MIPLLSFLLSQSLTNTPIVEAQIGAGAVATAKLKPGCISADATGRALFAAGVLDEATCTSAIANAGLPGAKVKGGLTTGQLAPGIISADATGRALFAVGVLDAATCSDRIANGAIPAAKVAP